MKTLTGFLAVFALACGSAKPTAPQQRVALVFGPPAILRISGYDRPIMRALRDHVHATRVTSRLADVDEKQFDIVVVMLVSGTPEFEQSYDPAVLDQLRASTYPIEYEVRRGGATAAVGSITLVVPDVRSTQPQPYIRGLPELSRDLWPKN